MAPRNLSLAIPLLLAIIISSKAGRAADAGTPEAVITAEDEAYNAHDINRFIATYADDAEIYEFPSKLLMKGTAAIADFYINKRFNDPKLHTSIEERIVMGDTVVEHEKIVATFPEGPGKFEAILIYEIKDGKIAKATLIRGARTLDTK